MFGKDLVIKATLTDIIPNFKFNLFRLYLDKVASKWPGLLQLSQHSFLSHNRKLSR